MDTLASLPIAASTIASIVGSANRAPVSTGEKPAVDIILSAVYALIDGSICLGISDTNKVSDPE